MSTKRLTPEQRKHLILEAAVELSIYEGYEKLTRENVAAMADCTPSLVTPHYYRSMEVLKAAVISYAVDNKILEILAEALVYRSPLVEDLPHALRTRAAKCLIERG